MSYGRIALARPIKITSAQKTFSHIQGGTTNILSIAEGLYADIGSVYKSIQTIVRTVDSSFWLQIVNGKWYSSTGANGQYQFSFTSSMAEILGFNSTTPSSGAIASYFMAGNGVSNHLWISSYGSSDQDPWSRDIKTNFSGALSRTGQLSGVSIGDERYEKEFKFMYEPAKRVFQSECTTEFEASRAFDKFIYDSMTVQAAQGSASNPKGFWVYYDASNIPIANYSSTYSGIHYNYTSDPDIKTLAQVDSNYSLKPRPVITQGRDYYNIDIDLHTMSITEDYI